MRVAALRTIELICFLTALAFLIPPVASDVGFPYRATPAMIIGGFLFTAAAACLIAAIGAATAVYRALQPDPLPVTPENSQQAL